MNVKKKKKMFISFLFLPYKLLKPQEKEQRVHFLQNLHIPFFIYELPSIL